MILGSDPEAADVHTLLTDVGYSVVRTRPERVQDDLARYKPRLLLFEVGPQPGEADVLIQRIQATAYGAVVPVMFFGPPPGPNPAEVVAMGGDLHLPTPIDGEELLAVVSRWAGEPPAPTIPPPLPMQTPAPPTRRAAPSREEAAPLEQSAPSRQAVAPTKQTAPTLPLDDLDALDAMGMPWDGLASVEDDELPGPGSPGRHGPDLLRKALAADLMQDPLGLARSIKAQADKPPPGKAKAPAPPTPPPPALEEPFAVDAIVQEFVGSGRDGDTVAVRIRRTINAFEEQVSGPEPQAGTAPPSALSTPTPEAPPARRRSASYEIDLAALDRDTIAGVELADPQSVLQKLEDGLGHYPGDTPSSAHPPSDGERPRAAPPRRFASSPPDAAHEGLTIPPPEPGSDPGVSAALQRGDAAAVAPSAGTIADGFIPIASPYDLPPVVSAQGFEYIDPLADVVDTVPGRRTAVHLSPDGEAANPGLPRPNPDQITRPAKPRPLGRPTSEDPEGPEAEADKPPRRPPPDVPAHLRRGSLSELDPGRLFHGIAAHELDGALIVTQAGARFDIFFDHGAPKLAQSSRKEDRMLEMLRRQGRLTAEQADECVQEISSGGRRAGAVLLDRGWMKSAELIPTVRRHLEDVIFAVFALRDGAFEFDALQEPPEEIVYLDRRPAALVLEGVRRKYTPDRIIRLVGSENVSPIKVPEGDEGLLAGADLSGRDWRIIDSMDGRQTIAELAETLDARPHDVWTLAWALTCLGLISLQRTDRKEPPSDELGESRREREHDFAVDSDRVISRHAVIREGDYFACLGTDPRATPHELRRAYDLAREQFDPVHLHPAVLAQYGRELDEIREILDEAYGVLSDEALCAEYRAHVVGTSAQGAP